MPEQTTLSPIGDNIIRTLVGDLLQEIAEHAHGNRLLVHAAHAAGSGGNDIEKAIVKHVDRRCSVAWTSSGGDDPSARIGHLARLACTCKAWLRVVGDLCDMRVSDLSRMCAIGPVLAISPFSCPDKTVWRGWLGFEVWSASHAARFPVPLAARFPVQFERLNRNNDTVLVSKPYAIHEQYPFFIGFDYDEAAPCLDLAYRVAAYCWRQHFTASVKRWALR